MNIFYPPLQEQMFVIMFLMGFAPGIIYDVFRIKRRILGASLVIVFVDDLIFSLFSVAVFLLSVFCLNNGIVRWFEVIFFVCGFMFYILTVSRIVIYISFIIIDLLKKIFLKILHFALKPVTLFFCFMRKMFFPIENLILRYGQRMRIERYINDLL